MISVDELTLPEVDGPEIEYGAYGSNLFTIALKADITPLRRNLLPKRYWGQMRILVRLIYEWRPLLRKAE